VHLIAMTMRYKCNHLLCFRWRIGEWGGCDGCIGKPGHKYWVIDCVKQSPFEDSEDVKEGEGKRQKPSDKESCSNIEPCADEPLQGVLVTLKDIPLQQLVC
jgi:hypothetical protein